jgi:hypothetical protein
LGEFEFQYNLTQITGTLHEGQYTFFTISRSILLIKRNFLRKLVEKLQTHILSSLTGNRAVYEIMWEKCGTAGQTTDDSVIRRMRFARWITKATKHTLRICNTPCFPTATMVARTRLFVTLYVQ